MVASPGLTRWGSLLAIFCFASLIESFSFSQMSRFLPLYLESIGTPASEVPTWTGVLNASVWIFGLPLVPFWGVWAERYGRKVVIARSAFVEAAVFLLLGLATSPMQAGAGLLLVGFQLGNTGVMLAALRSAAPPPRLGTVVSLFGLASALGGALGPALGGLLVGTGTLDFRGIFIVDSALSLASGSLMLVAIREGHHPRAPAGRAVARAGDALRQVFTSRVTLVVFGVFALAQLGQQIANPFLPLLVRRLEDDAAGAAADVGVVFGASALVGALLSPVGGALGDRFGYRRMVAVSCVLAAAALAAMTQARGLEQLTAAAVALGLGASTGRSMVIALLATVVPEDRRTATLNLVLVPSYIAGIAGGVAGTIAVRGGLDTVLVAGAALSLLAAALATRLPSRRPSGAGTPGDPLRRGRLPAPDRE